METPFVTVKVLFFAKSKDIAGKKEAVIDVPKCISYKNLVEFVVKAFGLSSIQNSIIIAKNEELCSEDSKTLLILENNDELAVIPPLSGG